MEQDWGRRYDHVLLEEKTIATMLQPVFPGRLLDSVELLAAGKCNTNYKIEISGLSKPFVLRVHVRDRMSGQRDLGIFQLVKERVPVPHILYTTTGSDPGAISYTVMSWVEGILFSDVLASNDKSATGQNLGATLTQRLWSFLNENAYCFDALDGARSLVHSDYKGFNILVRQVKGWWKVSGVLDWEFAFADSPLTDIGNMLRYSHLHSPIFESEFIHGYREQGGILPPEWKKLAKLVDLLSLCEFLNAPTPRNALRQEVTGLIVGTLEHWEEFGRQSTDISTYTIEPA